MGALNQSQISASYSMEIRRHVGLKICLMLAVQFIFLVGIGSCLHSSSFSSEVDRSNSNSDSVEAFSRPEIYITKPYFEKYGSLLDSNFQAFLTQELSLGSCVDSLVLRLSVLKRHLIGEGSHRRLSSSIRINIQSEVISELPTHFCEIIIIEKLPSGVFADPFELQHLLQQGAFTDAAVFGDTNLELPSMRSSRSLVEVHMDIGPNFLSTHKNGKEINIELPLHARYPPLEESGSYTRVEFDAPVLFMRCSIEGNMQSQSCLFLSEDYAESITSTTATGLVWEMPSGKKAHAGVVSVATFVSAMLSTLFIVLASLYFSDSKLSKNSKQS